MNGQRRAKIQRKRLSVQRIIRCLRQGSRNTQKKERSEILAGGAMVMSERKGLKAKQGPNLASLPIVNTKVDH